ncbi:FAD linked oxidase domain protein [Chthoniobacter flavus Ellin428]|uniref:FAD linked oxidase domain protein n=1 Tax=Chthoniobacter flavus Ellin428 TaxID=497964 RepID=B4CWB2_9BACT|nr:FAD-binding protein [Chthoniobacter flavus]EDY21704.1 FAD linked oxidase domain protein [Chthoniobacter flavus Ellin428]TCO95640.1 glycolate oxidase FAD binding subunit [Chthoniobacter flavus]
MNTVLTPTSAEELVEAVRSTPRVIAVGAGTKPRLSQVEAVRISMAGLRGIKEYDPSEFTFTAAAGTPLGEIADALAERGQYLPFDPMLVDAGATLGGTVAAGVSGPGRFRYGGLRDFVLGVRFVDGTGRLLRMGGKVVKNAAGFDLPKFFVGSLGRFGVLAEMTFKVFPRPPTALTLRLRGGSQILSETANSRFEFDALDIAPGETDMLARLCGPEAALKTLSREIFARWPGEIVSEDPWTALREFRWVNPGASLIKVAVSPAKIATLEGLRCHLSAGGNFAFVSGEAGELDERLCKAGLSGVTLRGEAPLWLGVRSRPAIAQAVKQALDPVNRFPPLDD